MEDMRNVIGAAIAIPAATYTTDNPPAAIDRQGFDSVTFVVSAGIGGITFTPANRIDFVIEHSDDGTSFDPVGPTNVLGAVPTNTGVVSSFTSAQPNPSVQRIGYVDGTIGDRRYVRLRAVFGGTHGTGTPLSAVAILGDPRNASVA